MCELGLWSACAQGDQFCLKRGHSSCTICAECHRLLADHSMPRESFIEQLLRFEMQLGFSPSPTAYPLSSNADSALPVLFMSSAAFASAARLSSFLHILECWSWLIQGSARHGSAKKQTSGTAVSWFRTHARDAAPTSLARAAGAAINRPAPSKLPIAALHAARACFLKCVRRICSVFIMQVDCCPHPPEDMLGHAIAE